MTDAERAPPALSLPARLYADLVLALHWLTRLPWPRPTAAAGRDLAAALWAFPIIGALIGGAGAAVFALAVAAGAAQPLAAVLAIGAMVLLTGALHEDGLADCCDGLGARGGAAARLAAMRDSRLGVYGALGLVLVLLLRVQALAQLAPAQSWAVLPAAAALGRAAIGLVMRAASPAGVTGAAAAAGPAARGPVLVGCALAAALLLAAAAARDIGPGAVVLALLLAAALAHGGARSARRLLGGYSGDVLGATSLAVETMALLVLALALTRPA